MQTHLGDIAGLVPAHRNKASLPIKEALSFAGGGSCLQFVKMAPVKCSKATGARRRRACIYILTISQLNSQFLIRNSISENCRQDRGIGV